MQYSLQGLPAKGAAMFLDAACVLCGRPEADALLAWQQLHGHDVGGLLELLKSRHLVAVGDGGHVLVHDVLRWFARRVVLGKAGTDPAVHGSRLWVQHGEVAGHDPQVCPQ
jgi:hypothetical protein